MEFFVQLIQASLVFMHSVFSNWGFAIIGVTVAVRLVCFPLVLVSTRQQTKLRGLKPKLDAILAKYKDDPFASLKESQALKAQEGVRPLVSLVVTLIQGFVLFGMYKALGNFSLLQAASFAWIPNLAAPDPLLILPLFAAACTWAHVRMGNELAPEMAKVPAWIFPALSFAFTIKFASGLALYYFAGGAFQIASQLAIKKWS